MPNETHFKIVTAGVNRWTHLQNRITEMGTEPWLHYIPVSDIARAFIEKELAHLHHTQKRFAVSSLIGIEGVPNHTLALRTKEANPPERQVKEDIDLLNDWMVFMLTKRNQPAA